MIEFDHVTKRYKSNIGLDDVSVKIEEGDFVFLVQTDSGRVGGESGEVATDGAESTAGTHETGRTRPVDL